MAAETSVYLHYSPSLANSVDLSQDSSCRSSLISLHCLLVCLYHLEAFLTSKANLYEINADFSDLKVFKN